MILHENILKKFDPLGPTTGPLEAPHGIPHLVSLVSGCEEQMGRMQNFVKVGSVSVKISPILFSRKDPVI